MTLQTPASPSSADWLVPVSTVTKDDSSVTYFAMPGNSLYLNAALSNLSQMSIQKQTN